jgi:hypothetical protein
MKRTAIATAAVLLFAGMTTLSIANENAPQGKSTPAVQGKSEVSPAPVVEKKNEAQPGAEHSSTSQKVEKVAQTSAAGTEKNMTDKKEAPASTTTNATVKDNKVEQKPQATQPATSPTK